MATSKIQLPYVDEALTIEVGQQATGFYYASYFKRDKTVHISGDIRGTFTGTVDYTVLHTNQTPIINSENAIRYPISTDTGGTGYAYVSSGGSVHIVTKTNCTAVYINIDFRTST